MVTTTTSPADAIVAACARWGSDHPHAHKGPDADTTSHPWLLRFFSIAPSLVSPWRPGRWVFSGLYTNAVFLIGVDYGCDAPSDSAEVARLVACKAEHVPQLGAPPMVRILQAILEAQLHPTGLPSLVNAAGEAPPELWPSCDPCWGTGEADGVCERCDKTHACACPECEGFGHLRPSTELVCVTDVAGVSATFDRRYVAEVAAFVGSAGGRLSVAILRCEHKSPSYGPESRWLIARCGARFGVVMAVNGSAPAESVARVLTSPT